MSVSPPRKHCMAVALSCFFALSVFIRINELCPFATLSTSALPWSFSQWPHVGLYIGTRECCTPLEIPDGTHESIPSSKQRPGLHPRSLWPY